MSRWESVPLADPSGRSWDERPGPEISNRGPTLSMRKWKGSSFSRVNTLKYQLLDHWRGWRTGIAFCIVLSTGVLALNVVLATISHFNETRSLSGLPVKDGLSTLYQGDCGTTKRISLITHLVINILSTILLGASNYCMQILASPTRDEIDAAHSRQRWLRVGVPNFQNLTQVDWKRAVLCVLLGLSSLPLHLLWNSAVVQTVSSNDFFVGGVTTDFLAGANATAGSPQLVRDWFQGEPGDFNSAWFTAVRGSNATHLTASECINAYGTPMVQTYSNVAIVFNVENSTNSLLFAGTHLTGADEDEVRGTTGLGDNWVCGLPAPSSPTCEYSNLAKHNASYWTPLSSAADWKNLSSNSYLDKIARSNVSVSHCLAQVTDSPCRIGTTSSILYAVVAANALKVFCFISTWILISHRPRHEGEQRIVTNGDLIASYLRRPDMRFAGRCLASARLIRNPNMSKNHGDSAVGFWDLDTPLVLPWLGGQNQRQHKTTAEAKAQAEVQLQDQAAFVLFRCGKQRPKTRTKKTAPRWHTGPSGMTWLTYVLPSTLCIIALLILYFNFGLQNDLFLGFGQPSTQTTVSLGPGSGPGKSLGVIKSTLIANAPQLMASYIYVACNSVLTSMLAHHEVSTYAVRRRGLRVSFPKRNTAQRATYFLQVPWKIALPLMTTSTVLHWCMSQSLFLLRVAVHSPQGEEDTTKLISTVGYSSSPILASLAILAAFVVGVCALSWFKRYEGAERMPLVASCSASLAAATCPGLPCPESQAVDGKGADCVEKPMGLTLARYLYDEDTAYSSPFLGFQELSVGFEVAVAEQPLTWGAIPFRNDTITDDQVGHAMFSAGTVEPVEIGRSYA
ncbi:hypothetical protein AB5N19_12090 [Seiridium cardinale]